MYVECAHLSNLLKALLSVPNLRRLDLSDNNFSGKTGELLMEGLRNKVCILLSRWHTMIYFIYL